MSRRDYRHRPGPWRDSYVPYDRRDDYYDAPHLYEDNRYNGRQPQAPSRYEDARYEGGQYERGRYERERYERARYEDGRARSYSRYESDRTGSPTYRRSPEGSRRHYSSSRPNEPSSSYTLYNHQPVMDPISRSPPKEPVAMRYRDERSVTPPPVRAPSPSYLALTEETPSILASPSEERKLLILDLNGTLVHRAPYTRPKNKYEPPPVDELGRTLPRLRPVHPRPYMPAFRRYLFSPETKKWLDVMIWSSAQPHSVNDMVDKCFGDEKGNLVTIWARDTLGLSEDHYSKKVQTVKDLTTPWTKLPALLRVQELRSRSRSRSLTPRRTSSRNERNERSSSLPPTPPPSSSQSAPKSTSEHSALTTLLLDDSPAKAARQPYNHVCLPEYSAETRAQDLELLHSARRREVELQDAEARAESSSDASPPIPADSSMPGAPSATDTRAPITDQPVDEMSKKRKRLEKKEMKRVAKRAQLAAADEARAGQAFDETLLAVIGVLDTVREQQNVAAWIRTGGLWGPHPDPTQRETQSDGLPSSSGESAQDKVKKESVPSTSGNDAASSPSAEAAQTIGTAQEPAEETVHQPLWFEHPPTLTYWVARGRQALENLGIPIVHGIER